MHFIHAVTDMWRQDWTVCQWKRKSFPMFKVGLIGLIKGELYVLANVSIIESAS
jgi:hypothetical protein